MSSELYFAEIKTALKKDFDDLYQKQYCTDFEAKRLVVGIEIGIMDFDHTKKLLQKTFGDAIIITSEEDSK